MINSLSTDFLIRLKNSSLAGAKTFSAPSSKYIISLAEILKKNGFISGYTISENKQIITVALIFIGRDSKISQVRLFSKPGRRWYETAFTLPWGKTPQSLIIVSTSSGLLTQKEAVTKHLGGEIIAEIW